MAVNAAVFQELAKVTIFCDDPGVNEFLLALLVSGSLGALIGLERQWEHQHEGRPVAAGVRTFALWGLLGAICAHLSGTFSPAVFVAGLVILGAWLTLFLFRGRRDKSAGFTTIATGLLTYLLGGLVVAGAAREALVVAVISLLLLAGQRSLHAWSQHITPDDARMALQFLAITGAVLPLVPDQDLGPYGAFNPRSVWLMVVIVSGLGFAGYVAIRLLGSSRGMLLTGLAGGLASSTATTLSMARMSREREDLSGDCALAIVLACTVMLWRVAALVAAIQPALAFALLPEFLVMSAPGAIFAVIQLRRKRDETVQGGSYKNPLSLKIALQFGAMYAGVVFVVKVAAAWFGGAGLLIASFLSGLTDLDAIALTLANLLRDGGVDAKLAMSGVVIATIANSLLKAGMAGVLGSRRLRPRILAVLGSTALLGAASLVVRWLVP